MTCCRLKIAFFVLLSSLVPATAVVEFGSGDHVCTFESCMGNDIEISPRSSFSLDCAYDYACRGSRIVVGSGSTFTGDFVCGAEDRDSYMSCREADVTFYATDVSTYKVSCHNSGEGSYLCRDTVFTLVDTSLEIYCDTGECWNMVVNLCGDSHVHVSGALDSGSPVGINRYGDDATAVVDETDSYSITNFAAEQCPGPHFTCDDGCQIVAGFKDDGVCDCSQCEDEVGFNCATCSGGCPTECGQRNTCSNFYECGGCILSDVHVDNDRCDCPNCEDEPDWDCSNCRCPDTCGVSFDCIPTSTTLTPTTTTLTPTTTTTVKPTTTTTLKPTTTTLTPTTTTLTPTTTTLTPTTTTTSKPTSTTPKPSTTTLVPTTTTAEPSTTMKPATTTLSPTVTTLQPTVATLRPTTLRPTTTTAKPSTVKTTTTSKPSTTKMTTSKSKTTTSKPTTTKRKLTTTTSEPTTATATVYPTTTTRKPAPTKTEDSSANPVTAACIWSWALILLLFIL